jgi:plastocyanin
MSEHVATSTGWLAAFAGWLALGAAPCEATPLEVEVLDEQGRPIADVAVYVTPVGVTGAPTTLAPEAVMDQHDQRFNPHLLVVQVGTTVRFPNSDAVSHHVYSFSPAKPFELGLYKGNVYPPIEFDKPGLVVVGCNIHDGMLGYILVVDTPYFTVTDEHGVARIDPPAGDYALDVWTPRARPAALPPAQPIAVGATTDAGATVSIRGRLAPPHEHGSSSLSWRHY